MSNLAAVKVLLQDEMEDYFVDDNEEKTASENLLRVDTVLFYGENQELLNDYEPAKEWDHFFDYEFHSVNDIKKDIAMRLEIDPEIVEVE
ncbi:hypothetical protein ACUXCC_001120 [Cytobacillus horneckiae]|uniref:Uncharacterized protein n=1 Tax=Cytobacillus horneckiae TaxID=549687 RepID=A0A2N0ZA12_9BACI|nr:hypothetical protein [Cytobacillus horneckiae]NRG45259.1 hypothetical protein [Bacillus sp. CRN 9]MBN6886443.1 hypothetical protein [Cytobacillus horneckiae]MCM3176686.1 hypothetical protein [Cytobacillus horneckiae]MEC1158479.1 hypothetical protein [Cytobacillus horneckiae]MED2939582.1 hypothetical protein [Cytobacillus horneckiae]